MAAGTVVEKAHPLLQAEALGRTLADIGSNGAPAALVQVIRWLDSFQFEEVPFADLARLVVALDEAAQPQLRYASELYLSNAYGSRSARYKAIGRDYYASLGRAYDLVMAGLATDFSLEPGNRLRLEMLLRMVRAAAGEMKWVAFDYHELTEAVWRRAGAAYRAAHAAGGLNVPVTVREGRETRSTISREFTRLVALQCASLDQLPPDRIEATDKLVRYLQTSLDLSIEPADGSLFSIDLAKLAAPRRVLGAAEPQPGSLRYFRAADAVPMLDELRRMLAEGALDPAFAGVGAGAVASAIRHLSRQWGPVPPMRQYRRHPVQGSIALATGLGFIRSLISGEALMRPAAAWSLTDASRNGFAVSSPNVDGEVCRVGAMVAANLGDGGRWVLAVVRRVRLGERGAAMGLQTISSDPQLLVFDDGSRSWNGILCDVPVAGRGVRIACEPGLLRTGIHVFAKVAGRLLKLTPAGILQNGPGYQIVGCNVV